MFHKRHPEQKQIQKKADGVQSSDCNDLLGFVDSEDKLRKLIIDSDNKELQRAWLDYTLALHKKLDTILCTIKKMKATHV